MMRLSTRVKLITFFAVLLATIAIGVLIAININRAIKSTVFTFDSVINMKVNYDYWYPMESAQDMPTINYDNSAPIYTTAGNFQINKHNISVLDVYNHAELIIKAKATNDRSFGYDSIKTKVIIQEVYKGNTDQEEIYVYEWSSVNIMNMLQNNDVYNIMNTDDEYYLFLIRRPMPEGYKLTAKNETEYVLANVYMGKYKVEVYDNMRLLPPRESLSSLDELPTYQEIKEWDILPVKSEQIGYYMNNRKEALFLLGITN